MLCSWARHFTLTVPLSTQVYEWVLVNLILGGNPMMDEHPIRGGGGERNRNTPGHFMLHVPKVGKAPA